MSTDVWKPKPPKMPSPGHLMAVLIELCIAATFFANRSIMGLFLCVCYLYFSATWALLHLGDDDES